MKDKIIESGWKVFVAIALFVYNYSSGADLVLSVLVTLSVIGLAEVGFAILALIFYGVKYLLARIK